jgi:uncharacterized protein (UPF0335 family)
MPEADDPDLIRELAREVGELEDQIADLNERKSAIYKRAKAAELIVPALRLAIAIHRRSAETRDKIVSRDKVVKEYLKAINDQSSRTRAPAHEGRRKSKTKLLPGPSQEAEGAPMEQREQEKEIA